MLRKDSTLFRYRYDFESKLLKKFLRERYLPSNSEAELLDILTTRVQVNGLPANNTTVIFPGDWIEYIHYREDEKKLTLQLTVIYEDQWLIGISKPNFLPVTPTGKFYFNSLAILAKEQFNNEELTPLHRLDIETTGVLLFCKQKKNRGTFQKLFERKKVNKRYQAIVFNCPKVNSIEGDLIPAAGSLIYTKQTLKAASSPTSQTLIEKQQPWGEYTRVWLTPVTGKTNQLRVHLASINCPIVGDKKYFPDEQVYLDWFKYRDITRLLPKLILSRQALHCEFVKFEHPFTKKWVEIHDFTSDWQQTIDPLC